MSDVLLIQCNGDVVAVDVGGLKDATPTALQQFAEQAAGLLPGDRVTWATVEVTPIDAVGPGDVADALVNGGSDDVDAATWKDASHR